MLILKGIREASLGHWLWLTVGTAVAANSRGPQFESSHRKTVMSEMYLFNSQLHWKGDNKEKETIDGPFVKKAPHSATCFASIFKFWPLPASFSLFLLFQYSAFEMRISGLGSNHSTNWATTTTNCFFLWSLSTSPPAKPIKFSFFILLQCDQMERLFLNIRPFVTMKISPIMSQICQSRPSILPNKK